MTSAMRSMQRVINRDTIRIVAPAVMRPLILCVEELRGFIAVSDLTVVSGSNESTNQILQILAISPLGTSGAKKLDKQIAWAQRFAFGLIYSSLARV